MELVPGALAAAILVLNSVTFLAVGRDKSRARQGARRIPERTLLGLALLGGSLGLGLGMVAFRHKTRKRSFLLGFAAVLVVQLVVLVLIIATSNRA